VSIQTSGTNPRPFPYKAGDIIPARSYRGSDAIKVTIEVVAHCPGAGPEVSPKNTWSDGWQGWYVEGYRRPRKGPGQRTAVYWVPEQ
jgi:hypothetical protein